MRTSVAVGGVSALFLLFLCNAVFSGVFALVLLCSFGVLFLVSLFLKNPLKKNAAISLLFCILPLLSFCYFYFFRYQPDASLAGKELTVTGVVAEPPTENNGLTVYKIKPMSATDGQRTISLHGGLKLYDYTGLHAKFNEVITVRIKIRQVQPPSLFDFGMRQRAEGNYLTGNIASGKISEEKATKGLNYYSVSIRTAVKNAVNRFVKPDSRAIATVITTGDKSELMEQTEKGLVIAGVMHLTAVSGTHFVYILGFLLFLFDLLGISRRKTYVVCMVAGLFICLASGFTPSVLRSFLVSVILFVGLLIYRETEPFNSLMAAGVIIMLFHPFAAGGLSFLLSFLAAAGIITVSGPTAEYLEHHFFNRFHRLKGGVRAVTGILLSSFAATVFTLPVSASCFTYISSASPVTNLLLVPPAAFLPVLVFLMTSLSPLPLLAGAIGFVIGLFTEYINLLLKQAVTLEDTMIYADKPYFYFVSFALIVFFLLSYFKLIKLKRMTVTLLSVAVLLTCISIDTVLYPLASGEGRDDLYFKFIDVGQGDSTLIAKEGSGVLVDGGGDYDAADEINRQLEAARVKKLQAVILTHAHADHINALTKVLRSHSVSLLVLPQSEEQPPELQKELVTSALSSGTSLKNADTDLSVKALKDVNIEVLTKHVEKEELTGDENERSNVIKVTGNGKTALIMGDLDETVWKFVKYYNGLTADIVRVGHHGSAGTLTDDFLLRVKPSYAIISVGEDNRYGHPSKKTLDLLNKYAIPFLTTAERGTITAKITKEEKISFSFENRE